MTALLDLLPPPRPPWPPPTPAAASVPPAPAHATRRRLVPALVLAAIVAALAVNRAPLLTVALVFVLVVPFEKLFWRHRQRVRRPQVGTDIAYALLSGPLNVVGIVAGIAISVVSLLWVPGLALRPLVMALPFWPRTLLGIALFDLTIYWAHRFGHEVPFLWRFHRVHHSTEQLDWVSGFRTHPFDGVLLGPAVVFLLAAGFSPQFSGILLVLQIATGLFLHANVRWRWRPLHRIVITPEFHHWHHANQPESHNTNYSVFLPIWDILFGTYRMPRDARPERYGVDGAVPTGIVGQLWQPMRGLRNPLRTVRHPIASVRVSVTAVRRGLRQMAASVARPSQRRRTGAT